MTTTIKLEGFAELDRELGRLTKAAGRGALRRAGTKSLEPIRSAAVAAAPDDPTTAAPEDLKSSIKISGRGGRMSRSARAGKAFVELYMGPTKEGYPQAIFQEFGTVNHAPQAYMRPAWDGGQSRLLADLKANIWAEIQKSLSRAARKAARARG